MSIKDQNNSSNTNQDNQPGNSQRRKNKLIIYLIIFLFIFGSVIASGVTFFLLKGNEVATKAPPSPTPTSPSVTDTPQSVTPSPTPTSPSATETPQPITPSPTPTNSPDILTKAKEFSDRVDFNNQEKNYSFSLDKPSNVSIYLDKVTDEVGVHLYVDTNGNGFVDNNEQLASDYPYSSTRAGAIQKALGADKYIVVVKFRNKNSDYTLQLVNNTYETVDIGSLKGAKTFNDSINRNSRQKFYKFSLSNPSNVSLFLDKVTSQIDFGLYVDKNGNGIIDDNSEQLDSASAYSSSPGKITKTLGADDYFVVVSERERNTNYSLTVSSP
jgi:cytoskeletal protein RodZ